MTLLARIFDRQGIAIFVASLLAISGYIASSAVLYRPGFPLDDAWIHQTYARNLGQLGEWSFLPGQPTAGSTAPLWTILLAVGHLLRLPPLLWAFLLGWISLFALGKLGAVSYKMLASKDHMSTWLTLLLIFEWHLVWAGASGMETLLFSVLMLLGLTLLAQPQPRWGWLGLLIGCAVWIRPDGLTLLGPAFFVLWLTLSDIQEKMLKTAQLILGFSGLTLPYFGFNLLIEGSLLPNTFFAKQAEYRILQEQFYGLRLLEQFSLPLIGVGVVLLPGFVRFIWISVRDRQWPGVAVVLWCLGYLALYAWRLPVTYQHGRYVMPVMPVFLIVGFIGMVDWAAPQARNKLRRVLSQAWFLITGVVVIIFYFFGSQAYARDVAIIETEMVNTANWIQANTSPEARIAAHDIGALGYFTNRDIFDLAGLISPDVIPFIRDEVLLEAYLDYKQPDYLMTLAGWYPYLEKE